MRRMIHSFQEKFKLHAGSEVTLIINNKQLFFNDMLELKCMIECRENGFINIEYQQITRLYKILALVEDQPIVIYFDGHKIDIQNLYI